MVFAMEPVVTKTIFRGVILGWLLQVALVVSVTTNYTTPGDKLSARNVTNGNVIASNVTVGNVTVGTKNRTNRQLAYGDYSPYGLDIQYDLPYRSHAVQNIFPSRPSFGCPVGSVLHNGECIQPLSYCPPGYNLVGNTCVGQITCQPGYSLVNGQCQLQAPCTTQMCGMVQQTVPPIVQPRQQNRRCRKNFCMGAINPHR
uniref:Uncharacterized protein n=1 Tax=Anopheles funestus TaxID=62324 RepID=A0A4Y0BKA9_ANOFN